VHVNGIGRALLARMAAVGAVGVAATAGVAWAASQGVPTVGTTPAVTKAQPPAPLVVPDLRNLPFVFAKGELEDAGFAWRVQGSVHGYPANVVLTQSPAPGAKVVDTGAPLVTLTLKVARGYPQEGEPEDSSPYGATRLKLAGLATR
jgi:beta-lactam-binding protein with PASTA domain